MRNTIEHPVTKDEVLLSLAHAMVAVGDDSVGSLTMLVLSKIRTELQLNNVTYTQMFAGDEHFES